MENLIKLRKSKSLSQEELGKKIGLGSNTISQYELGKRNPNIHILKKLAKALDCKIDDLIDK